MELTIVDVMQRDIALSGIDREYRGRCPFCNHLSESLRVDVTLQVFACDRCETAGDVLTWLMKMHGLTFRESLHHLADLHGITLERRVDEQR